MLHSPVTHYTQIRTHTPLGMKQGLEDQTRDQRQGEFIDNQVQKNPNSQQLSPKGTMQLAVGFSFSACFWVQKNFFPQEMDQISKILKKKREKNLGFL